MTSPIQITDTILRDAHQCLIATRLRTEDMLPVCPKLDQVGYWSLEAWGGATFDACVRYLKEDPWERLRTLRRALPNTRIQMLLRGQNLVGYRHYADDVVRAFVQRAAHNGVDVFRIFDALNDTRNLRVAVESARAAGAHAQGTICYTTSPVHGVEEFVAMGHELQRMGCESVAIKDMAGLLTPAVADELVARLVEELDVPIHVHTHDTAGLAALCQLKAVERGAARIDTAISSFSGGASHPPTESMVAALRGTPWDTGLDLTLLQEIGFYFHEVRKRYRRFESEFTGIDTRVQVNQVPGGMISNLIAQLREQNGLEHLGAVLEEIPRVRHDLGYPPLVTPTSQIVGTQAVINVLTGERYKSITNEVKRYLQGHYGRAPAAVDERLQQRALGGQPLIQERPADHLDAELERLRSEIGSLAESEEDVLTYAMFPEIGRAFLEARAQNQLEPEPLDTDPDPREAQANAPTEFNLTLHGETYHLRVTGTGHRTQDKRPFYVSVDGMPEEVLVETLDEVSTDGSASAARSGERTRGSRRPRATTPGHVTASMPGTVIDVLVNEGDRVEAGAGLLVAESMKMETEIQAPIAGRVARVHVAKGERVNPDETLIEIEAA